MASGVDSFYKKDGPRRIELAELDCICKAQEGLFTPIPTLPEAVITKAWFLTGSGVSPAPRFFIAVNGSAATPASSPKNFLRSELKMFFIELLLFTKR
jgi:hypothetical protein